MNIGLFHGRPDFHTVAGPEPKVTNFVLVVEKLFAARRMLRFGLELHGYSVVEVEAAAVELDRLAAGKASLLILGLDPDDAAGPDLVRAIRRRADLEHLPVLLIGTEQYRHSWDLGSIGNCFWLNRPFRLGELHQVVEGLLGSVPLSRPYCCGQS